MSTTMHAPHAVLNWEREEVRVPSPHGQSLVAYLARQGFRGDVRTDCAGDLIALDGEPDMGRVRRALDNWERETDPDQD